jgi:toxin ParE1/3/4
VPRYRLSRLAEADLADILATSARRWGREGRRRHAALLAAAMRQAARDPHAIATHDRSALLHGLRSLHTRHARGDEVAAAVRRPVHVIYYRLSAPGVIDIVRVLHGRMEPGRHLSPSS